MQEPKQTAENRMTIFTVTVDGQLRDAMKTAAERVKGEIRTYCAEHRLFAREIIVNMQGAKETSSGLCLTYSIARRKDYE